MPQDRDGTCAPELVGRDQRTAQALGRALMLALLALSLPGVSTRQVAAITEPLGGTSFAKRQVAALAGRLEADLAAWRPRPLPATDPDRFVAARDEQVRGDGRVVRRGVLVVAGVRGDGRREVLAGAVADPERTATSPDRCRRRRERGRPGVALVTSDDHAGWRAAISRHCQGARWQRGPVPFARNVLGLVGAKHRARRAEALGGVFPATTVVPAHAAAQTGATGWRASHPQVAAQLAGAVADCLAGSAVPAAHRARIRTTNGVARLTQDLNRRPRVVRLCPPRASLPRLVTALAMEQSAEWISGRRSLDLEPPWEARPRPVVQAAA